MGTKPKNLILWKNDPLLYLLKEKLGFSNLSIILYSTVIAAIVMFGLGWIADRSHTGSGMRLTDPLFYSTALFHVIFTPLLAGAYVWQPGAFANVLQSFEQTDIIQTVSERGTPYVKSYPDFLDKFQMTVDRKRWAIIAAIWSPLFLVGTGLVVLPSLLSAAGGSAFWYDTKWFGVVVFLNFFVWIYVICIIVLKQVQAILYFNRLFQWFDIRIHPMHPDQAGGLGALGNFTLKTSAGVVAVGVAIATFTIIAWSGEAHSLIRPDIIGMWTLYILLTPMSLILPMLSAHNAMQETRDKKLYEISQEFEKSLSEASVTKTNKNKAEAIKEANEKLKGLQTRYNIVTESFPTWPVPARLFRNFSITASLPLVSGLVSMAIDFATK